MKGSWIIPGLILFSVVGVLVYFNYERGGENIPLKELFKDDSQNKSAAMDYEIVTNAQVITAAQSQKQAASSVNDSLIQRTTTPSQTVSQTVETVVAKVGEKYFTVQVASYKEQVKAQAALEKIKTNHPGVYVVTKDLGDKGIWYRVYSGKYQTVLEAQEVVNVLKQNYPQSYVVTIGK